MPRYQWEPLDEQLRRLERSLPPPKVWHVIWVIPVGRFFGVFFEFSKKITDMIYGGHESEEDARIHAMKHKYHRRFDAWLFNAETGEAVRLLSELNMMKSELEQRNE